MLGLLATLSEIEGGDFLQDLPHLEVAPDEPAPEHLPRQVVGPYRLLRQIGVGGMGTVWLAERADGHVQRHVALKLPRATWGGSFARRLARESRILATLEHDHIARLYDAGLDAQGRPFLALEYVEGEPIDVYCRERALPLRDREGLLLQTMAAVSHAHARLIVHRDLKPANILVTRQGQVKLLDFGIAKLLESELTEATALTRAAGRALTLDYASPEQIRGEPLGTGSDIYSLGVVAYELLAEARPYRLRRGSAAEIEEAIADADPIVASDAATAPALRKALRGDLDAILNRALKKSVDERYASVDAFAQDLQRHLRGEPVQARPDSRGYRVRKFVRRNRLAVALTSTLAASVLVGGGLSAWQALVAGRQERRAEMEAARQQAVRDLYDETMAELNVMANEHPDAFAQPHMITKALQDKLHEIEPRLRDQPEERAAQLEAVMLQLNYTNEFEASLAVGHEYLAHLKARGGTPEQIIIAVARLIRTLDRLIAWYGPSLRIRMDNRAYRHEVLDAYTWLTDWLAILRSLATHVRSCQAGRLDSPCSSACHGASADSPPF
ncbi:MAG: serine/threonine-protein kinase [Betaproteobacteria bacterium]